MKVLHLLATGNNGGIERLVYDFSRFSSFDNIFVFAWQAGILGDKLRKMNKKVYDINGHKIGNLNTIFTINSIIKKEKVDVIIVHHASALLRFISIFQERKKVIVYQHNDPQINFTDNSLKTLVVRTISKYALKHASKVIAISNFVKDGLIKFYKIENSKIFVVYNGTDINDFYFKQHEFDGTLHFVTVSRLTQEKGVQNAITLLSKLPNYIPWDYTIIGEGDYMENLKELVADCNFNNINFLGDRNDISELLDQMDIFLHLADCNEGFGITVIEAMAKGKVCVVNDKGAMRELIDNRYNGFLINNIQEGVFAVESVFKNPALKNILEVNSRNSSLKFSVMNFVTNLEKTILS